MCAFQKKRQLETIRGWVYAYVGVLSIFYKLKWYENLFSCSEYRWYVPGTRRAINQYKQINSWIYSMFYRAWITQKKIYLFKPCHSVQTRVHFSESIKLWPGEWLTQRSSLVFHSVFVCAFLSFSFSPSLSLYSSLWLVHWLGRSFSLSRFDSHLQVVVHYLSYRSYCLLLAVSLQKCLSLCLSFSQNLSYAAAVCSAVYLVQNAHLFLLVCSQWQ